jgi:hypothetical protein
LEQQGHILNRTKKEALFEIVEGNKIQHENYEEFITLKLEDEAYEMQAKMRRSYMPEDDSLEKSNDTSKNVFGKKRTQEERDKSTTAIKASNYGLIYTIQEEDTIKASDNESMGSFVSKQAMSKSKMKSQFQG